MAYRVGLSARAEDDAYAAFERIREAAPMHAEKWLIRLFAAIDTLGLNPARCPVIPEADELGSSARHLLYGKGRESIASYSTSGKTSGTSASCASGMAPAMPSPPPTWRNNGADFIAYRLSTDRQGAS
jgi:plasmid stabilization system protein ParE